MASLTRTQTRPRRRWGVLLGLLALISAGAYAALSGLVEHLFFAVYAALAFPVEIAGELLTNAGRPTPTPLTTWAHWMHDPAARYAWLQRSAQQSMHGPMLVEVAVLGIVLAAVLWRGLWFGLTRVGRLEPTTVHGDARWLTRAEARRHLRYRPSGLVLGQLGWRFLALPPERQVMNTLLVGPPGSGKSAGVIIPTLLREPGGCRGRSLVITDLKSELLRVCHDAVARTHEVWVVNLLDPTSSRGYNPLDYCTGALAAAAWAQAWVLNTGTSSSEPFWENVAVSLLQAGVLHLRSIMRDDRPTLAHLYSFLGGQAPASVIAALERSPSATARQLARGFLAALQKNERALGSAFSEIAPRFRLMQDERVQATTSINEVDFRRLGRPDGRPIALFLTLDRRYQQEMRPLLSSFFLHLFSTLVVESDAASNGQLGRPVAILADEFGNIGVVPSMSVWVSSLRSSNVSMTLAVQTTAQLTALYGNEGAGVIRASCRTKLGLSGMVDQDARWFSDMAGQCTIISRSASANRRRFHALNEGGGQQLAEGQGRLLTADQVQRLPTDALLAIVGELPAVIVKQRRYYRDRALRDLWPAQIPPQGLPRDIPLQPPLVPDHDSPIDTGTDVEQDDQPLAPTSTVPLPLSEPDMAVPEPDEGEPTAAARMAAVLAGPEVPGDDR